MDLKQYIASGILENYVLGLVSEEEKKEVEQNINQYPELKKELDNIEDALAAYAKAKAIPMPAGLSEKIIQSIEELDNSPSPISDSVPKENLPKEGAKNRFNSLSLILGFAILASLIGNFLLFQQKNQLGSELSQSQAQYDALNERMTTLQLDCDAKDATIQQLQEQIAILKNPAYNPISLKGTDKAPEAVAVVYYNATAEKSFLNIGSLPNTPVDKDYQLWAIVDGAPTDMGIFDLSTAIDGFLEVPHINNPQAFAITLETKGGNPTPNLNELYIIGNVTG